jgi:hypothetical protein
MATAIHAAPAVEAPPDKTRATRWTPVGKAFALAMGLRIFYSLFAAFCSPFLKLDPGLIRSNSLTGQLMSREANPRLYAIAGVWERFDTLWYIQIARHGYESPMAIVFYPLYPALIRGASLITRSELAAALAVSTAASFLLCWGALRLFELDYSQEVSSRALVLWMVWPASFAFFAGYADSLLCALIVWAVYLARSKRWLPAGMSGLLAGCTKAVGCFVALPLLWIAWKQRSREGAVAAAISLVGTAGFEVWLAARGFPSAAQIYRTYWRTTTVAPWISVSDATRYLSHRGDILLLLNLTALIVAGSAALGRSVRFEYRFYAFAAICLFLSKHTEPLLQSTTRYSLALFAAYPALSSRLSRGFRFVSVISLAASLNLLLFVAFLNWGLVV